MLRGWGGGCWERGADPPRCLSFLWAWDEGAGGARVREARACLGQHSELCAGLHGWWGDKGTVWGRVLCVLRHLTSKRARFISTVCGHLRESAMRWWGWGMHQMDSKHALVTKPVCLCACICDTCSVILCPQPFHVLKLIFYCCQWDREEFWDCKVPASVTKSTASWGVCRAGQVGAELHTASPLPALCLGGQPP